LLLLIASCGTKSGFRDGAISAGKAKIKKWTNQKPEYRANPQGRAANPGVAAVHGHHGPTPEGVAVIKAGSLSNRAALSAALGPRGCRGRKKGDETFLNRPYRHPKTNSDEYNPSLRADGRGGGRFPAVENSTLFALTTMGGSVACLVKLVLSGHAAFKPGLKLFLLPQGLGRESWSTM